MEMEYCANCGGAESKDGDKHITLKSCGACKSVRFCSAKCQKVHWSKHKGACKMRAAELIRDKIIFKQPDGNHLGDCPICCLPMPANERLCSVMVCCSTYVCWGCRYANVEREYKDGLAFKCPFCRSSHGSKEENNTSQMKRAEANNPIALCGVGRKLDEEGDYNGAFKYYSKAHLLGNVAAEYNLAELYYVGKGTKKDETMVMKHLTSAAIGGHPDARYMLGAMEFKNGGQGRAVKHWIIAAKQGNDEAIKTLKQINAGTKGLLSKVDFSSALRGHQLAAGAAKSRKREEALEMLDRHGL